MAEFTPATSHWRDQLLDRRGRTGDVAREPSMSRRSFIRRSFWTGLGVALVGALGSAVGFLYPRNVRGFGGPVAAGELADYPPGGAPVHVPSGFFWMVHLDAGDEAADGGSGLLALWQRCPHLGCSVDWLPRLNFDARTGWFRCPCHQSTYTRAGVRVHGPAPRSMDTMRVEVDAAGRVTVQTGEVRRGGPDNPSRALRV